MGKNEVPGFMREEKCRNAPSVGGGGGGTGGETAERGNAIKRGEKV